MLRDKKSIIYIHAFLAIATVLGASIMAAAQSQTVTSPRLTARTLQGQEIPAGAFGIVIIDGAREASLLQLRGIAGSGVALLRNDDGKDCLSLPLRFVAGDFGGDSIAVTGAKSIRLTLNDVGIVQALIAGQDIVSDDYRVGTTQNDQIAIQEGMTAQHGFVLNPGRSLLADIFGVDVGHVECSTF